MADRLNELEVPLDILSHSELQHDFAQWTKGRRIMLVVNTKGDKILVAFRKVKSK